MPRHPPNALKSLDALITIVHLGSRPRQTGRQTIDLRKTYMCSICLPQSGQALRPVSVRGTDGCYSLGAAGLKACKQIPSFTMSISKTPAQYRAAKLVIRGLNGQIPEYNTELEWWSQTGSNRRPEACKATALPTELWPPSHSHDSPNMIRSDHRDLLQSGGPGKTRTSDLTLIKRAL